MTAEGNYTPEEYRPAAQEIVALPPEQRLPRELFEKYTPQVDWFLNPEQAYTSVHGIGHLDRVKLLAWIIGQKKLQQDPSAQIDFDALLLAGATHDTQRSSDTELWQPSHGHRAAAWVREQGSKLFPDLSRQTIEYAADLNNLHGLRTPGSIDGRPADLQTLHRVFWAADSADVSRIVPKKLPKVPGISISRGIIGRMERTAGAGDIYPLARKLGLESMKDKEAYLRDPHTAVLKAAEEIGLIR